MQNKFFKEISREMVSFNQVHPDNQDNQDEVVPLPSDLLKLTLSFLTFDEQEKLSSLSFMPVNPPIAEGIKLKAWLRELEYGQKHLSNISYRYLISLMCTLVCIPVVLGLTIYGEILYVNGQNQLLNTTSISPAEDGAIKIVLTVLELLMLFALVYNIKCMVLIRSQTDEPDDNIRIQYSFLQVENVVARFNNQFPVSPIIVTDNTTLNDVKKVLKARYERLRLLVDFQMPQNENHTLEFLLKERELLTKQKQLQLIDLQSKNNAKEQNVDEQKISILVQKP